MSKFNFNYCLHDHAQAVDTLIYEIGLLARFFFKEIDCPPIMNLLGFHICFLVAFTFSWYLWKKS